MDMIEMIEYLESDVISILICFCFVEPRLWKFGGWLIQFWVSDFFGENRDTDMGSNVEGPSIYRSFGLYNNGKRYY